MGESFDYYPIFFSSSELTRIVSHSELFTIYIFVEIQLRFLPRLFPHRSNVVRMLCIGIVSACNRMNLNCVHSLRNNLELTFFCLTTTAHFYGKFNFIRLIMRDVLHGSVQFVKLMRKMKRLQFGS